MAEAESGNEDRRPWAGVTWTSWLGRVTSVSARSGTAGSAELAVWRLALRSGWRPPWFWEFWRRHDRLPPEWVADALEREVDLGLQGVDLEAAILAGAGDPPHRGFLVFAHPARDCRYTRGEESACCIHAPSAHCMAHFPQHWRDDIGIMERVCDHGIGHPDPDATGGRDRVHGCDGCCKPAGLLR